MSNTDAARRQCLRCKEYFDSEWSGNRVCKPCQKKNEKLAKGLPCFDIEEAGYPLPPDRESFLRDFAELCDDDGGMSSSMHSTSSQVSAS